MKIGKYILVFLLITSCKPKLENMDYQIEPFKIIGIAIESTNENGQSIEDMGKIWSRFYQENVPAKIPNKESENIYSIFTDYESDYTGKFTSIIGMKVSSLDDVPDGLVGREFDGGKYLKIISKGEMPDAIVETWKDIWKRNKELKRRYTADWEVYGEKSQNGDDSEVEVYIGTE